MALTGTLKDFGIADVLQRVGQQLKSGVLHVRDRDSEVHLLIATGAVVGADHAGRQSRDRLGSLLVRAAIITPDQLEKALAVQKRTLRRLGDLLVEQGALRREDLREITALQTRETVHWLFSWKGGVYEFEPREVEYDRTGVTPLPCEDLLAEGFRIVDEWPVVRRKISSPDMTFERQRPLDAEMGTVTDAVRAVDALATPGRTAGEIADLSRLGEFESQKALFRLVNLGVLRPVAPPRRSAASEMRAYAGGWRSWARQGAAQLVAAVAVAAVLASLAAAYLDGGRTSGTVRPLRDDRLARFAGRYQEERIRGALEVFRLERGYYPNSLDPLVQAGLLRRRDLSYPWDAAWWYRPDGAGYRLLPPVE